MMHTLVAKFETNSPHRIIQMGNRCLGSFKSFPIQSVLGHSPRYNARHDQAIIFSATFNEMPNLKRLDMPKTRYVHWALVPWARSDSHCQKSPDLPQDLPTP